MPRFKQNIIKYQNGISLLQDMNLCRTECHLALYKDED